MINYLQAFLLGGLQGVTELFPISSLGHSVILPKLLNWNIAQDSDQFLMFLVATHLATAIVLFFFFLSDWMKIARGLLRTIMTRKLDATDVYARLGLLLIVGTIPAGILGLLLETKLKHLFATPLYASCFLFLNGIMLYGFEKMRKSQTESSASDTQIAVLSYLDLVKVGFAQAIALLPGFSRTGATLGGGLLVGLNHANAARLSFLMATPIIAAAAIHKLPKLLHGGASGEVGPILFGAVTSAIAAYLSVRFLSKYFETKSLAPFALYCSFFGGVCVLVFALF
jgi:undecaprenyl-diphosphatase